MIEIYRIIFFIFGILFGSFCNVLIHRLPLNQNIVTPRSKCPKCNNQLKFYHNIPVLSWIFLRGKCGFCKENIPIFYPLIEIFCGLIMYIIFDEYNIISSFFLGIIFMLMLSLSVIDIKHTAVPEKLLFLTLFLSIIYASSFIAYKNFDLIIAGLILAFIFWTLRFLLSKALKKEAMGDADIYIAWIIGNILGIKLGLIAIYISAILTLPIYIIIAKKDYQLAFVPFLSMGLFISYVFMDYLNEFLQWIL